MMEPGSESAQSSDSHDENRGGILHRIEEKLNRLLGRRDDEWHDRAWAPLDSPFAFYSPGDPSPRFFGGPSADAPGWDPSLAGPRFDRINPGAVGSHAVDPVASYSGAQTPLLSSHSSAREYYLLMRARAQAEAEGGTGHYADYRARKMHELDREYAAYRRDQQERFDSDFDAWREKRKGPPGPVEEPLRSEMKAHDPPGAQSRGARPHDRDLEFLSHTGPPTPAKGRTPYAFTPSS